VFFVGTYYDNDNVEFFTSDKDKSKTRIETKRDRKVIGVLYLKLGNGNLPLYFPSESKAKRPQKVRSTRYFL